MAQMQLEPAQMRVTGGNGAAAASGGGGSSQMVMTSLFVAGLDKSVTESQLYDLFNQVGQVVSVKVVKDTTSEIGHGYVNYSNPDDAARALDVLNFTPVNSKTIRIMYSERDPSSRKNVAANVFIKNLDKSIDGRALHEIFSRFGTIKSCKIETDSYDESKGYGFVQFDSEEAAQKAIDKLDGMLINDKQLYVGRFVSKEERDAALSRAKFNNIYVKNLSATTSEEDLRKIFGEYGRITSVAVMRDVNGKSKCFGFVNFDNADDAAKAVEALNGKKFDDKEWYVGRAQKKSERMMELKSQFEQTAKEQGDKSKGLNLYVKNLDDSINDDKLKDLFSEFGTITSCKVMRDPSGISRGSGFVAFSTPEEASRALAEMNGKMTMSKPLYVAIAERKEERRARLQAQFSQARPVAVPPVTPPVPVYQPGATNFGQNLFYGQGPLAMNPSQAEFSYQQLAPAMRAGVGHVPNLYVPVIPSGQRPSGRRGAGPPQQTQQSMPLSQHQMMPRGRMYRFPPGRNMADVMPGDGGVFPGPYGLGGMLPQDAPSPQPMPITALASALANAPADQQRIMLGENLYPLVDQLEHNHAAKVTGMLLEMDQTEVLHLLESPDSLKAKVAEAMEVLKHVSQVNPTDQLANLSLNDNLVS
ncbi:hypothetical protein ACET3Z_016768 [Daucus carota]